ncbi:glycosyltransferase family 4 protein [Zymobacter sp. IVIA_5232.4 C2]|uniref:glycosyltransferase family 4 protein n=1 Tax=Zymobacter sp. IVIA_5232.4 C2 TaxID=3394855 RepID=UPI0039C43007
MHIADMTMFYAPSSGGVRTYLEAKRQRLVNADDVCHSLLIPSLPADATPADGIEAPPVHGSREQRLQTLRIPAPPLPFSGGYRFPLRTHHWVNALDRLQPDIIEAGDPYVVGWAAIRAARRLNVPLIAFYHSDLPEMLGSRFGNGVRHLTERYIRHLYRHYDSVLAPSQLMAQRLAAIGVERVSVQPLGVDTVRFTPDKRDSALRQQLGLADDIRLLIFAGRGSQEKNLPVLLETLKLLGPQYHLLMVGSNMPRQTPNNVTTISRFCPPDELAGLLASADALLHAGTQETFGLVILEAMASGLPVVAANAGALPEMLDDRYSRLCAPLDAQDMARATRDLFEQDIKAMGTLARQRVERHHGWDAVVNSLRQHYEHVIAERLTVAQDHAS